MMTDAPIARTARYELLGGGSPGPALASTSWVIRDGAAVNVVDPGLASSQASCRTRLSAGGVSCVPCLT